MTLAVLCCRGDVMPPSPVPHVSYRVKCHEGFSSVPPLSHRVKERVTQHILLFVPSFYSVYSEPRGYVPDIPANREMAPFQIYKRIFRTTKRE